jgi:ribosomal protein S6--L-glutamate ligase
VTRIGIISAYADEDWDSQRICAAARARGAVEILAPTDFGVELDRGAAHVTVRGEDARAFDLFLTPRAVGEAGDAEFQIELYQLLAAQVPVVNDVGALVTAIDKFKSSWRFVEARLPTPRVVVVQRLEEACRALVELRQAVVKPLYGSLGIGVELLSTEDGPRLRELLDRHRALYLQAYVSEAVSDVRAFVVGDRVEAAIARRARPGEFRANIHLGADFQPVTLDGQVAELAVRATRLVGLDYSGVDLLLTAAGPMLLEVNGTPSFRGVNAATGRDMAHAIVEHAIARVEQRQVTHRERRRRRLRGETKEWRRVRRVT